MIQHLIPLRKERASPVAAPAVEARPAPVSYVIPGRCLFEDGEETICQARDGNARQIEIRCRRIGAPGSVVVAYLDNIGLVRGKIGRRTPHGFVLLIEVSDERRARIAARLDWHAARAAETAEQRAAPRIVPLHREVAVRLGDDLAFRGHILDLSMTGAAIAAPARFRPYVGSVIKVGKRHGSVVRLLENGFAVQFALPFIRETFNEHVIV